MHLPELRKVGCPNFQSYSFGGTINLLTQKQTKRCFSWTKISRNNISAGPEETRTMLWLINSPKINSVDLKAARKISVIIEKQPEALRTMLLLNQSNHTILLMNQKQQEQCLLNQKLAKQHPCLGRSCQNTKSADPEAPTMTLLMKHKQPEYCLPSSSGT